MNVKKSLRSRIRGWFPQEPNCLENMSKIQNLEKKQHLLVNVVVLLAAVIALAILLLSVYAQIAYQAQARSNYFPSYAIHADKLDEKPAEYFVLSNPDQYVIKVIDGEESYVIVHYDDTQIDELTRQYSTNNLEYNGSYYAIGIAYVDSFPQTTLPHILAGFVVSILAIVILSIFQVVKHFKQPIKIFFQRQGVPLNFFLVKKL